MAQKKTARKSPKSPAKAADKAATSAAKKISSMKAPAPFDWSAFTNTNPKMSNIKKPMEDMMAQGKNQYENFAQEAANTSRESMEALAKAMSIWAKGSEEIMRAGISLAQNAAEKQAEFLKKAMASKSINELAELQNKVAQKNYDELLAEATKISELGVKTLTECTEPLNAQINKAVQKASESMAA